MDDSASSIHNFGYKEKDLFYHVKVLRTRLITIDGQNVI